MIIAMSRPKNLRDVLTRAALKLPGDLQIRKIIEETKQQNA
jgi:ribosomal protein L16/L10AE